MKGSTSKPSARKPGPVNKFSVLWENSSSSEQEDESTKSAKAEMETEESDEEENLKEDEQTGMDFSEGEESEDANVNHARMELAEAGEEEVWRKEDEGVVKMSELPSKFKKGLTEDRRIVGKHTTASHVSGTEGRGTER